MSTTKTTPSAGELIEVPVAAIEAAGNPREHFDPAEITRLAESIRERGLLSPLVVSKKAEDEGYELIAGERRLRACREAGLERVPVFVRSSEEGERLELAVIENALRQDLNPIEEARAFKRVLEAGKLNQKGLAQTLRVSTERVRERLALLRLPEDVQEQLGAGKLPLSVTKRLREITKVSPALASACAARIAGDFDPREFEDDPAGLVAEYAVGSGIEAPLCVAASWSSYLVEELPVPGLHERARALGERIGDSISLRFGDEDLDAARAYGCLLEFGSQYMQRRFVCDFSFLADRVALGLERFEKELAKQERAAAKQAKQAGGPTGGEDGNNGAREQDQAQEREAERKRRVELRGANLDLGTKLAEQYARTDLTEDVATVLIELAFQAIDGLGGRGLRYTSGDWQSEEVKTFKNGREPEIKVEYLDVSQASAQAREWVSAAKTPKQRIGRLIQALVAAGYASEEVIAQSRRSYCHMPPHEDYASGKRTPFAAALERLAAPALPKALKPNKQGRR